MRRDLDEIEMEMGKERTMKVGDRVRTNDGKAGEILVDEWHDDIRVFTVDVGKGGCGVYLGWQLIPVEPERVQGRWYCANPEGCYSTDGIPDVHPATCAGGCEWLRKHSPGLLQRMGMATWPTLEQRIEALENILINGVPLKHCTKLTGGLR